MSRVAFSVLTSGRALALLKELPAWGGQRSLGIGFDVLTAHGEMAERIRSFPWENTPIGPPHAWSPTLRTMVRFLLANRFPLLLWWGPQYVQIYNDAYRAIPGDKHPRSLGQTGAECWPEVWDKIGPLVDTPFQGGPPTWAEDIELHLKRKGFTEETHFTIAYSPVPDETAPGGIGGVLATVHEITEKLVVERRIRALRDLGLFMAQAKTAQLACERASEALACYAKDIPFGLLYLTSADGARAQLAAKCSCEGAVAEFSPEYISLTPGNGSCLWPLRRIAQTHSVEVVANIQSHFTQIPLGPWPDAPKDAAILPIRSGIDPRPTGFWVAGLSSRLAFDKSYQDFLEMAAGLIGSALSSAKAYEQERQRVEALTEIDRAKTTFFANVSHEFRTPLTLMLGPLEEVLSTRQELPEGARQNLETARRNSLRLLKLVNALLDYSRIEAGRAKAHFEAIDLSAFTTDLASMFRSLVEDAGLRFEVDCPPLTRPVSVDREMWEKIVLNLISNAFKFTVEGSITVRLRERDGCAVLTVADTGAGIPEADLPHIFERFHRVERTIGRSMEGTGIGLALIQELVKEHEGRVEVDSRKGSGSTFTVRIPYSRARQDEDNSVSARASPSRTISTRGFVEEAQGWIHKELKSDYQQSARRSFGAKDRKRILLADDNADMRDHILRTLGPQYEVLSVEDGEKAFEALERVDPELLLSDVMMPGMDGFELLARVRSHPRYRSMPIILLSARAGEESRNEGMHAGADDYLVKPFSAQELLARVEAHLRLGQLRKDAEAAVADSERRYRAFVSATSDSVYVMSPDWSEIRYWQNNNFIADSASAGSSWITKFIAAEHQGEVSNAIQEAIRDKRSFELEHPVTRLDGSAGWAWTRATPILDEQGRIIEWLGTARDITTQKREQQLSAEQRQGLERIASGEKLEDTFVALTEAVARLAPGAQACIITATEDRRAIHKAYSGWFPSSFRDALRGLPISDEDIGTCGRAMYAGEGVTCSDIASTEKWAKAWKALCLNHGIRACHSEPIQTEDRRALASLFLGFAEPRQVNEWELRVAETVAQMAAIALAKHRSEERLAESRGMLTEMVERSPFGIYIVDSSFRIVMMNHRSQDGAFINVRPLIGRGFEETIRILCPEKVAVEIWSDLRHTLETGEPFRSKDFRDDNEDAAALEGHEWELYRMRLPDGQLGVICYYYDSTELRQTQSALREQLRLTQALTSNAAASIFITDEQQLCAYVNPAAEKLCGYSAGELIGRSMHDVLHHSKPDGSPYPVEQCPIVSAFTHNEQRKGEEVFVRRDGSFYSIYFTASPLREGSAVIGTVIEVQDIQDRKRAEERLQESEQQLALLSNIVPALIYYLDGQGRYRSVNDSFLKWFDVNREDVLGKTVEEFVGESAWRVIQPKLEEAYEGKVVEFEAEIAYRSGASRWVHAVYTPHCDSTGRLIGMVALKTDIHHNKTIELELRRANEDLEQFAYSASHDLQEPIRNVALCSQLFQARYGSQVDSDGKQLIHFMTEGALRMSMLVTDLLAYTQSARMQGRTPDSISSEEVLQKVLKGLKQQVRQSKAIITHEPLPDLAIEEAHLQQLFQNLIGNAIKYAKPAEAPRVHVSAMPDGQYWRFCVLDNGIGIEAAYQEQVFGLFKRLDASRERGGTGIGLAICQKIVERYGGKIWVESELGKGSSFFFLLPRGTNARAN